MRFGKEFMNGGAFANGAAERYEKRKKLSTGGFLFFAKWCKIIHTEQKKGEWL